MALNISTLERDKDGRIVLPLANPVVVGSEAVSELRFRKLRLGDLRDFPIAAPTVGALIDVAGRMCGQTALVMDKLDAEDGLAVAEVAASFLPPSLLASMNLSLS